MATQTELEFDSGTHVKADAVVIIVLEKWRRRGPWPVSHSASLSKESCLKEKGRPFARMLLKSKWRTPAPPKAEARVKTGKVTDSVSPTLLSGSPHTLTRTLLG